VAGQGVFAQAGDGGEHVAAEAAHPAIVNADDVEQAQHTHAIREKRRTYLLRGLLICALCGRRMEGAWNNGCANYRCHRPVTGAELPRSVF
jgi:site-specific DNA recombinase